MRAKCSQTWPTAFRMLATLADVALDISPNSLRGVIFQQLLGAGARRCLAFARGCSSRRLRAPGEFAFPDHGPVERKRRNRRVIALTRRNLWIALFRVPRVGLRVATLRRMPFQRPPRAGKR